MTAKKDLTKWRRRHDAQAAKNREEATQRSLRSHEEKVRPNGPVEARAIQIERRLLSDYGRTKAATKALLQDYKAATSPRERVALSMVMIAHGMKPGFHYIERMREESEDPELRRACKDFMLGLSQEALRKLRALDAPGGFIHKPVGRAKGFDS